MCNAGWVVHRDNWVMRCEHSKANTRALAEIHVSCLVRNVGELTSFSGMIMYIVTWNSQNNLHQARGLIHHLQNATHSYSYELLCWKSEGFNAIKTN